MITNLPAGYWRIMVLLCLLMPDPLIVWTQKNFTKGTIKDERDESTAGECYS